jgi:protein-tyrosine phosphatase
MIPIADMHCHLLAGLDDGPREQEQALEMCRILAGQGVGAVHALAHQNEQYPQVTPERIRTAAQLLKDALREERLPVAVFPGAEVMVHPLTLQSVDRKEYHSIGDTGRYLLIELPHGLYVDLREIVYGLVQRGIRPILAHPEQVPELLFSDQQAAELIRLGCLFQLSTGNVLQFPSPRHARAVKAWVRRGFFHVIGSDGHSPTRRPPLLADACRLIAQWVGPRAADRLCGMNAMAILQGLPVHVDPPRTTNTLVSMVRGWFGK